MDKIPTASLAALLREQGAKLVGFGNMAGLSRDGLDSAVALALPLPADTVAGIGSGPTRNYFEQYHALNRELDRLAETAARYITGLGFRTVAQTTTTVVETAGYRTEVPHKTCATRAGLGWIGKSALLVTPEYGPAVRLTSVLTNGQFDVYGSPVNTSRCGSCTKCTDACPGHAIHNALWNVAVTREQLVDVEACRGAARKLAAERIHEEITLCGKCIQVCPYTQAYLKRKENAAL